MCVIAVDLSQCAFYLLTHTSFGSCISVISVSFRSICSCGGYSIGAKVWQKSRPDDIRSEEAARLG